MRNLPHGRASWAPTKDQLLQADNGWEASYPVSEWQDVVALAKRFKRTL